MAETFAQWFARNLSDIKDFSAEEFLVKGGDHDNPNAPGYRLNTDPPRELWPNVIPLARVLQALRARLGVPIRLSSVYRSPAYNASLRGAASNSQHLQFKAADFVVLGRGRPEDWAATLRAMRSAGGAGKGIGLYDTFVHVDVRSQTGDWDYRKGVKSVGVVLGTDQPAPPAPRPQPDDPGPEPRPEPDGWYMRSAAKLLILVVLTFLLVKFPQQVWGVLKWAGKTVGRLFKAIFNGLRRSGRGGGN